MDVAAYHDSATILEDEENATVDEALETHSVGRESLARAAVINSNQICSQPPTLLFKRTVVHSLPVLPSSTTR